MVKTLLHCAAFTMALAGQNRAVAAADSALTNLRLNVNPDHVANNDTLMWSLLGVLGLTLGMVGACGWGIYRQFRRSASTAHLLEALHAASKPTPPQVPPAPSGAGWEKPADWWKSPPQD